MRDLLPDGSWRRTVAGCGCLLVTASIALTVLAMLAASLIGLYQLVFP